MLNALPPVVMSMLLPSFISPVVSILKGESEVTPTAVKFAAFLEAIAQDEKTTKLFLRRVWDYVVEQGVQQDAMLNGLEKFGNLLGVPLETDTPLEDYLLRTARKVSQNILGRIGELESAGKTCPVCNSPAQSDDHVIYTCFACDPPHNFI